MMQLAKLVRSRGFHVTFVNTEFNHGRLVRSRGPESVKGLEDFRFKTIPDELPLSDRDATQEVPVICDSTSVRYRSDSLRGIGLYLGAVCDRQYPHVGRRI
ncbi:hypothetical protein L1049_024804 [Liquidambar formosana]|uniref:Uncharacterized protein n=1 Tax=Liquidambar formosana TaxID=63359 RepID=A0AAP0WYR9_LIQFO